MGISNTYNVTKVIVDQALPEIMDFKSRLTVMDGPSDGSMLSDSPSFSIREELRNPLTVSMSLKSLLKCVVPCKVWVVAFISEIYWNKGWCYTSCVGCKKKVNEENGKFFCNKCGAHVVGNPRYRIQVKVACGAANASFLLWNSAAEPIVGHSAFDIIKSFVDPSINNIGTISRPTAIEKICGIELLFKVSVTEKTPDAINIVYAVDKTCSDEELIEMHDKYDDDNSVEYDSEKGDDSNGDPDLSVVASHEGASDGSQVLVGASHVASPGDNLVSPDAISVKRGRSVTTDDPNLGDGEKSINSKKLFTGSSLALDG